MRAATALAALVLAATPVVAKEVNVTTSEDLKRAISAAKPGDEIVLAPGEYAIGRTATRSAGSKDQPIVVRALELGTARVSVRGAEGFVVQHPYWIFENLSMTGGRGVEHAFHVVGAADHTVIRHNHLVDFAAAVKGNGVGKHPGRQFPDDVLIERNFMHNTAPMETKVPVTPVDVVGGRRWILRANFIADFAKIWGAYGDKSISYGAFLKGNSKEGVFEQNLIICEWRHTGGIRVGLSFGGGGSEPAAVCEEGDCTYKHRDGVMRNNVVMNCPADAGIYVNASRDIKIFNNTIYRANGIDVRFPQSNAEIRNNIISGGIRSRDDGAIIAENNLVTGFGFMNWGPGGARYIKRRLEGQDAKYPNFVSTENVRWAQDLVDSVAEFIGSSRIGRGNHQFDSWFVAPELFDFRLAEDSEIVDRGEVLKQVRDDFCGNPRRFPPHDMGAIEYGGAPCDVAARLAEAARLSVPR